MGEAVLLFVNRTARIVRDRSILAARRGIILFAVHFGIQMDLLNLSSSGDLSKYTTSGEWDLVGMPAARYIYLLKAKFHYTDSTGPDRTRPDRTRPDKVRALCRIQVKFHYTGLTGAKT